MSTITMPMEDEAVAVASPDVSSLLPTYKRAPMEFVRGEGVELIDSN